METIRIRDPGWNKVGSGIRDKHPESATLVRDILQWLSSELLGLKIGTKLPVPVTCTSVPVISWVVIDSPVAAEANSQSGPKPVFLICSKQGCVSDPVWNPAVLRIRDILARIRIPGSVPLTNGSGSGSCYFVIDLQEPTKNFFKVFLRITFWRYRKVRQSTVMNHCVGQFLKRK